MDFQRLLRNRERGRGLEDGAKGWLLEPKVHPTGFIRSIDSTLQNEDSKRHTFPKSVEQTNGSRVSPVLLFDFSQG